MVIVLNLVRLLVVADSANYSTTDTFIYGCSHYTSYGRVLIKAWASRLRYRVPIFGLDGSDSLASDSAHIVISGPVLYPVNGRILDSLKCGKKRCDLGDETLRCFYLDHGIASQSS